MTLLPPLPIACSRFVPWTSYNEIENLMWTDIKVVGRGLWACVWREERGEWYGAMGLIGQPSTVPWVHDSFCASLSSCLFCLDSFFSYPVFYHLAGFADVLNEFTPQFVSKRKQMVIFSWYPFPFSSPALASLCPFVWSTNQILMKISFFWIPPKVGSPPITKKHQVNCDSSAMWQTFTSDLQM